jgi:hypothetical protein
MQNKLGGMALLRNIRNMVESGVDNDIIKAAINKMDTKKILPFRFIAAAKYGPTFEPELEGALFRNTLDSMKLHGKTILMVDVSGSMDEALSGKSDMNRRDAACALAMICREVCDDVEIYSFSYNTILIPPRRGFALRDAVVNSQGHGGTRLSEAVSVANAKQYDRLIVITDEQAQSPVSAPNGKGYMINVSSNKNGVGYGSWVHLDGMSESIIRYIQELEK